LSEIALQSDANYYCIPYASIKNDDKVKSKGIKE